MKRILTLLLSFVMLFSCIASPAFAAVYETDPLAIKLSVGGENVITVNAGDEIWVDFIIENKNGGDFVVSTLQNEIYFDKTFFEFDGQASSIQMLNPNSESADKYFWRYITDYSWGDYYVQILDGRYYDGENTTYSSQQLVAKVKFKVKDGLAVGTSGRLENWFYTVAYNNKYRIESSDMTVYIGEAPSSIYDITYMDGGQVIRTNTYAANEVIQMPAAPAEVPTGKRFGGWRDENGTIRQAGESYTGTSDMTFTAVWYGKYTLTFNTNGGSAIADKVEWEDRDIVISNYTTTKNGFTFAGWYEDAALTMPITSNFKLTENKTIYAKWTENLPEQYTLTFNTNGGSSISPITANKNTVISLSGYTPTRSGYTFAGWYADSALTTVISSVTLTADTTIYAKWTSTGGGDGGGGGGGGGGATVEKYTLTFATNGGSAIAPISVLDGTTVKLSQYTTTKNGYVFKGWCSDQSLTNIITQIKISANTTIYAKWEKEGGTPDYKPEILTDEHYSYIVGREGGMIAPESDITRAEVATIIYRLLKEGDRNAARTRENVFYDVNEGDWFNTAVSTLAKLGLVQGRTLDSFAPDECITRAELATIFARMVEVEYDGVKLFNDVSGHWAESYINEAATAQWIVGFDGLFRPDDNITRAEVMTLVNRVLNREPQSKADLLDGMTTWKDNADENAWYYLQVQEATNSHTYELKADGQHEKWTSLTPNPDWSKLEN